MSYHKALAGTGWVSIVPGDTYPDPIHLAEIDGFDIDVTVETADLENSDGDVIDSFDTKRVIEGQISLKDFSNSLLAAATKGVTVATGANVGYSQSGTIPTTPFQITVTHSATFTTDLGVIDLTSGKAMTAAATATGTGVYAVSAGVYTFNTADVSSSVLINYRATTTADTTATVSVTSSSTSKFGLHFYGTKAGKSFGIYVPQALLKGMSAKFAKSAWVGNTLKWTATADASNNLIYTYSPE